MFDAGCRPKGRLSCWVLAVVVGLSLGLPASGGTPVPQSGPAMTTVADTVYMADGTAAQGNLIIAWPAFVTSGGTAVAAGTTSTALGSGGALSVALVPNAGATPAGVYYTVVYQIGAGEVKTEYWVVPTTSPANLATVRATPGSGVAGQPASMQYVNSQLATVVHLGGTETITGTKTFATAPSVPAPTSAGQVANKSYVDAAASNVGSGSFLSTAGGTMTGPITLPANPAASMQATTKQYVDAGLATKGDLIAGLVPATELGSGAATAGSCLLGNGTSAGTWGSCASASGSVSTAPAVSQNVAQPAGTMFSSNNLANIRYVTPSWNWLQSPTDNLGTAGNNTIHLSPCPLGVDTSANAYYSYRVRIAGTGTAEAARVTGGACTPGASSGTIIVTTANTHGAGYSVGSASTGIQEAINDAWINDDGTAPSASSLTAPYLKLESNVTYNVYASVYLRGRGSILDGAGSLIACSTRDRCLYVGTTQSNPYVNHHKLYNLSFTTPVLVDGANVASVCAGASCSPSQPNGTYLITTAASHPFVAGLTPDTVDCEYYSSNTQQHWTSAVTSVPSSTSFTVSFGSANFVAGTGTFGWCNIENAAIEVNSDHAVIQDLNLFATNPAGPGAFSYGVVNDNDQQLVIERAANRSSPAINPNGSHATATWPIGAFVYERNDQGNNGITYLHDSEFTNVNCFSAGGNGAVFTDSVCQGFPVFGMRYFGVYQPLTFANVYEESTGGTPNGLYGTTLASQMGLLTQGGSGSKVEGVFPISGMTPTFVTGGSGTTERNYFVVPRSNGAAYGPVLFVGAALPTSGSVSIPVQWPSVNVASAGTLTWDLLVTVGQAGVSPPMGTGNYALATNLSGVCGANGMCTFTDTQGTISSYTVQQQTFQPQFWFWPANIAINGTSPLFLDVANTSPLYVASVGATNVSVIAEQCLSSGAAWTRSPIWIQCAGSPNNGGQGSTATVLQQVDAANNGPTTGSKGRLIFGGNTVHTYPNDLFTLQDSNYMKTLTANGERPLADAGDMALGLDQAGGLTQRAATSISSYINALPSGTNFLERLTAAGKTFNVPVSVNGNLAVSGGTVTLPVTGTGVQCLHVSATGVLSGTGADCGSGGGSGSGTVSSGALWQMAMYPGSGTTVSGDSALTDNGTTLSYTGSGGITATSGTFSGNLTVNGQLLVAGPWMVSTPIPASAIGAAGTGNSSLGISNDGNFYISASGGTPAKVATVASPALTGTPTAPTATSGTNTTQIATTAFVQAAVSSGTSGVSSFNGRTGTVSPASGDYSVAQVTGAAPLASAVLTGTPTAPTAAAGTNSTQIATTAYVDGSYISPVLDWGKGYSSSTTVPFNTTTGHMQVFGIYIDRPVKCSSITVYVVGVDNSANTYDIGLYYGVSGSSNNLIAHTGAFAGSTYFAATTTYATIPFGATVTLMPGRYYLGLYANEASATATLASNSLLDMEFYHNSSATITPASGGLPATFTGPADQMTASATPHFLLK